jgi:hypothetical protein
MKFAEWIKVEKHENSKGELSMTGGHNGIDKNQLQTASFSAKLNHVIQKGHTLHVIFS